jgi:glutamate racemase
MGEEILPMFNRLKVFFQNNPGKAIAIGVGAVVLAPTLVPLLKPTAKASLKTGVLLYNKAKESLAETREILEDIVEEAKAEIAAEQMQKDEDD